MSAYTFDDSTRAFASVRMSVNGIRPLPNVDEEGTVLPTLATKVRLRDFQRSQQFLKMKYIVYKYVWENIDNNTIVTGRGDNIDAFALEVSSMYEDLGKLQYF